MLVAFIDFEATGVDPKTARIIEYAVMLYDTELSQPLQIKTSLVRVVDEPSQEITDLTGITKNMLTAFGCSKLHAMEEIKQVFACAEYVVAHNGLEYDKILLEEECKRIFFTMPEKTWLDTMYDVPYPKNIKDRKLTHLATAHEFINPLPHRALADVFTMQKIFCKYPLEKVLEVGSTPMVAVRADVSFQNKDLARKRGYHWDGDRKIWFKRMRGFYLESEIRDAEFKVLQFA